MAAAGDFKEIEEVNTNCILMANLQQYIELLKSNSVPHQVQHNDNNVINAVSSVKQSGRIVEQNLAIVKETHAYFESLYNNLAIDVEKVNTVNRKMKETNVDLTTELAKYKNQENVSKSISVPNEEFSDDTSPSVALKFLNEVKTTIVTLQRVVKQNMTLDIHDWSSTAHQEPHRVVKDENFPIVNQVDARIQNFKIQFFKEVVKFVRDFKSLAKEADESLAKHKALKYEIERFLKAIISRDIMSIVQSNCVVDTSNIQTELERMKERFDNCIIKKENDYAKLWNDWYKNVPLKVVESNDLSNPVTLNSVPITEELRVVKNDNVIAPEMFRVNPFKTSREDKFMPINQAKASVRTNPITVPQPS
nr:hypothetical protein [Tanacetum cinerariifolium]